MRLKELRKEAGMTQAEFANHFEIPKKTVENWEQGVNKCPAYVEKLLIEKLETMIKEREVYIMNSKKFRELRVIKSNEDLPENAMYYSDEYKRIGHNHMEWTNLYDENYKLIEQVNVKYSNAIERLKRIVQEKDKNDIALMAYDLRDLGNGFYIVNKNEDTLKALESISKSIQR